MNRLQTKAERPVGERRPVGNAPTALVLGAVIVVLEMLDVLTTLRVMAAGGMEANPAISVFMSWLGPAWWVPKVIIASCIAGYFGTRPTVRWTGILVVIVGLAVVLNNIAQLLGN
ncbi:MAG TPA: DUF5658 family protein [Stellaceae bacterium]|nr:DUF5658 family protein [Stellaceae bacterium]